MAVFNNRPAIVSQLLSDDKIDASLKDDDNKTALKQAIDLGQAECVTILRQHGAPEY
jgi:ankyrin repeat protein